MAVTKMLIHILLVYKPVASMPISVLRPVPQKRHHSAYDCSPLPHPTLKHTVIHSNIQIYFRKASSTQAVAAERHRTDTFFPAVLEHLLSALSEAADSTVMQVSCTCCFLDLAQPV